MILTELQFHFKSYTNWHLWKQLLQCRLIFYRYIMKTKTSKIALHTADWGGSTCHTEPVGWKYCHFSCIAKMTLLTLMSVTLAIKGFLFFQLKSVLHTNTIMIMYDTQVSSIPKFTNIEIQFTIVKFLPQSLMSLRPKCSWVFETKPLYPTSALLFSFTPSNFYNYA